ncbi:uncharacterized protein A4U43_C08F11740 [Asparagus officinalis]|uniref:protein ATAF2-like n=1 Tax=Asparagus officinalis TaxID=4686 RepID=UPI00098E5C80|nr:protein ATAF2-like [Asparagus officinalis]XP_020242207.1 protein ATAF2-like [Asparagus officinalis]ONK59864.1 uncharacterized protein A4U43_C08F11740 [Asparagus officinalis]
MCPLPPDSSPLDIGEQSTDEEIVQFLWGRKVGDPIPSNVITGVNPFSIDPRSSPEGIWFLYTSEESQSHNEGGIIKVVNGYWRSMDDCRILASTPAVGRKTTRQFYVGQAPFGDQTGWKMQEYFADQIVAQDCSTLCRIFLQNDEVLDTGEQYDPVNPGDADGEYIEAALLSLLEQDDRNSSRDGAVGSQAEQKSSQVADEDKQRQLESSSRHFEDSVNENSMEHMQAGYDFSKEDFLELKDLYDPISSSSSSDNSSFVSMNSDECFDAEALLRDIENEGGLDIEEHVDYRLSVATAVRSNRVVIQPSPEAFSNCRNLVVNESETTTATTPAYPVLPSSNIDQQNDSEGSTSSSSKGKGSNGSGSQCGSSQGGSPSRSSGSKFRKIGKLGRKYCCLGPF